MSKSVDVLREALYESGLVQPLSATSKGGSLSVMCRQVQGQEKGWISTIDELLSTDIGNCELHVCRRYVRKDGKMAFGWFIGLTATNVKTVTAAIEKLVPIIRSASSKFTTAVVQREVPQSAPQPAPAKPSNFDLKKWTEATPRAPEFSGPDPKVPHSAVFRLKSDKDGSFSMPLPHIYGGDINKPSPGSNKGAALSGSSELFQGLNVNKR